MRLLGREILNFGKFKCAKFTEKENGSNSEGLTAVPCASRSTLKCWTPSPHLTEREKSPGELSETWCYYQVSLERLCSLISGTPTLPHAYSTRVSQHPLGWFGHNTTNEAAFQCNSTKSVLKQNKQMSINSCHFFTNT